MEFIVVDYCKGNLRSVQKGFELAGASARISAEAADIRRAGAIILPGVGSFADASETMIASGQWQAIRERISAGVPFFGICLGLQLLYDSGVEGVAQGAAAARGLGVLAGHCDRIANTTASGKRVKVPHVGWNQLRYSRDPANDGQLAALTRGIDDGSNFYFTHSYRVFSGKGSEVAAEVTHADSFPCMVVAGNVVGVQFHPEKSSAKGLVMMQNFVDFVKRS
jgi:glutamine amidotransferase